MKKKKLILLLNSILMSVSIMHIKMLLSDHIAWIYKILVTMIVTEKSIRYFFSFRKLRL